MGGRNKNMDTGIIVALILFCSAIVTSFITLFITKYSISKPQKDGIIEQQLEKVITPIQCILTFSDEDESYDEIKLKIEGIIKDNYKFVPPNIYTSFCENEKKEFAKEIKKCFSVARKTLGYNRIGRRVSFQSVIIIVWIIAMIFTISSTVALILQVESMKTGKVYTDIAFSVTSDGIILLGMDEYNEALDKFKIALAINQKIYGEEDLNTASSYHLIASVYSILGNNELALMNMQKAHEINYKILGESHPNTISLMKKIQDLISDRTIE